MNYTPAEHGRAMFGRALTMVPGAVIDAYNELAQRSDTADGMQAISGFMTQALETLSKAKRDGWVQFGGSGANLITTDAFLMQLDCQRAMADRTRWKGYAQSLLDAVEEMRKLFPLKVEFNSREQPAPAPGPLQVQLVGPLETKITSMPVRTTTTSIQHNAEGDITATTQVEADALV